GETSVLFSPGRGRHTLSHFSLNHHHNIIQGKLLFKQFHHDRGSDIIRQICDYTDRLIFTVMLCENFLQSELKNVSMNNSYMFVFTQGILKDRKQTLVNLYSYDPLSHISQLFCQCANSRADLQHAVTRLQTGNLYDTAQNIL